MCKKKKELKIEIEAQIKFTRGGFCGLSECNFTIWLAGVYEIYTRPSYPLDGKFSLISAILR